MNTHDEIIKTIDELRKQNRESIENLQGLSIMIGALFFLFLVNAASHIYLLNSENDRKDFYELLIK